MKRATLILFVFLLTLPALAQESYIRRGSSLGLNTTNTYSLLGVGVHYRYTFSEKGRLEVNLGHAWNIDFEDGFLHWTFLDADINYQYLKPRRSGRDLWYLLGGLTASPILYVNPQNELTPDCPLKSYGLLIGGGYEYYLNHNWSIGIELKAPMWITAYFIPVPHLRASLTYAF